MATQPQSNSNFKTNSIITEEWNTGYKLELELTPQKDLEKWQLNFELPQAYTIRDAYGVDLIDNGDGSYTIDGQNGRVDLKEGQSIKPVFIIDHNEGQEALPLEFTTESTSSEGESEPTTEDGESEPSMEESESESTSSKDESEPTTEDGESEPTTASGEARRSFGTAADSSPQSDGKITANSSISESWNGGYKVEIELTAESDVDDWQVDFNLPEAYTIRDAYRIDLTDNGDGSYTIDGQNEQVDLDQGQSIKPILIIDHNEESDLMPEFDGSLTSEEEPEPATEEEEPEPATEEEESEPSIEDSESESTTEDGESEPTNEDGNSEPVMSEGEPESATEESESEPPLPDGQEFVPTQQEGKFAYGEALQRNFLFLEANRSGDLPPENRIEWRSDSTLDDGSDVGVDLEGGYFDAGDHIKFIQPMAFSSTMLAWGGIDYEEAYRAVGQIDELREAVKWATDWFVKAHEMDSNGNTRRLWVQVGDKTDHQHWVTPEEIDEVTDRKSYYIDAERPGSDAAAGVASALASASMLFRGVSNAYADELIENAIALYEFAETYQAKYSDSVPEASPFYTSWSSYWDELSLGGAWLYKATGDNSYLKKAENYFRDNVGGLGDWTYATDDHSYGAAMILAQESEDPFFKKEYRGWIDTWIAEKGAVNNTPGGFAVRAEWASIPINMATSFAAEWYNDNIEPNSTYSNFARNQVDYVLGDNPNNYSFLIGFGENYPLRPHHRGSAGSQPNNDSDTPNDHILHGAIVGGPAKADINSHNDRRNDFITNEVGTSYNAPFASAVIQQYDNLGGNPLTMNELDMLEGIDANGVGIAG